ncbi:hypothetical protein [Nitrosomonas sp.]|uniref:STAS domain-containing protein n=1 Tax=Nitrosomonas sp. TaxID=42353 RepID=UPI0025FDF15A|nr:hypothetical protein [Nitrosomonas sp.]MCC6917137.1 hypothetical protein [Nitrosomonas sp.]
MSANNLLLDFTSPGSIPPDPAEAVQRAINETQVTMQALASLLENDQIENTTAWKLLAIFYLATDRVNDLARIEKQYKSITGRSLSAGLRQKCARWFNGETISNPILFEIPKKITAAALPDNIIQRGQHSPDNVLLDFSQVQEIDNEGLKKLAALFSSLAQENVKPRLRQADRFIACLQNKAEKNTEKNTQAIWDVLFAYERFCNNRDAFEEKAIRFATLYGISPPSWE